MKEKFGGPFINKSSGYPEWDVMEALSVDPMVHFSFGALKRQRIIYDKTFGKIIHT
jgi:hypothetical protein